MPQNFKKYTDPVYDGRRKILPEQHVDVCAFYAKCCSQRKTAEQFGVSRRLIVFILHPDRLKAMQDRHKEEQHWKTYYDKEEHTKAIKQYRAKKKLLGLAYNPNQIPQCTKSS